MQTVDLDSTDRRILGWLQKEPGINASELGERIGLSQSACWRRIQSLRDEGVIKEQPVKIDREKVGLNTMVFAHVKLTSHGRSNLAAFSESRSTVCIIYALFCYDSHNLCVFHHFSK